MINHITSGGAEAGTAPDPPIHSWILNGRRASAFGGKQSGCEGGAVVRPPRLAGAEAIRAPFLQGVRTLAPKVHFSPCSKCVRTFSNKHHQTENRASPDPADGCAGAPGPDGAKPREPSWVRAWAKSSRQIPQELPNCRCRRKNQLPFEI